MPATVPSTPPTEKQASPVETKAPWFDAICAILMAAASLSTAWCTYQNSRWNGRTADFQAHADALQREATAMTLESRQYEIAHLQLAMKAVDSIVDGDEKRAKFYTARFNGELKPAWDKWVALNPFDNPSAPPNPFGPEFYKPRFAQEIRDHQAEAASASKQARGTSQNASNYLGNTVLLATVLFFAGTAGKFDHRNVRQPSLAFAIAIFVFAAVRMFLLPIA
jgi:hypothetical protein